jgi:5-methylcytosine-specific restriction endonuclease McrA
MGMKICTKCKKEKELNEFNYKRSGKQKDTPRSRCRECEHKIFKEWTLKNRVVYLQRRSGKKKENRDKYNFYERKRKFLLRSPRPFGSHSFKEWERLKKAYQNRCLCCEKQEPEVILTGDHIIPISKGGSNFITNIQPLCIKCNQIKNSKSVSYIE